MSETTTSATPGKARFDHIYNEPDPRPYFRRLAPLQYEIPHHAQAVFRRTRTDRSAAHGTAGGPVTVLDLCCSYGINAALLNCDLTLADLYERYTGSAVASLSTEQLIESDREFYAAHRLPDAAPAIGLDMADNAVRYALAVGLLDEGYAENLESTAPSAGLRRAMARTGLITVTGGVGYITDRTFDALLEWSRTPLWVSAFVLRTFGYEQVSATLAAHGLVTESDPSRVYRQRLFASVAEQRSAIRQVRANGADPAGLESEGRYYTRLYESRPQPGALPATEADGRQS